METAKVKESNRASVARMSAATSGAFRGLTRMSLRSCGLHPAEQLFDIGREGTSQFFEDGDCRILQSTFKTANIGSVDPSIDGKRFLRQVALQPKTPDISRDNPAQ
jgi:hypothetical protein